MKDRSDGNVIDRQPVGCDRLLDVVSGETNHERRADKRASILDPQIILPKVDAVRFSELCNVRTIIDQDNSICWSESQYVLNLMQ